MTIQEFAELVQREQRARYARDYPIEACSRPEDWEGLRDSASRTRVVPGRKYTKVNVGDSGRFMVDDEGNIYGIKAYGVIHRGHRYGNLATVDQWHWGEYRPVSKLVQ